MSDATIKYKEVNDAIKSATGGKKIKGFAKWLTYAIIIIAFGMGVVGSFAAVDFDMEAYTSFLPTASLFVIPLIVSIGASSITEKVQNGKKEREVSVAREVSGRNNPPNEGAVG